MRYPLPRLPAAGILALIAALVLATGCGGSDNGPAIDSSGARGSLYANPPNLVPVPQPDGTVATTLQPALFTRMLEAGQPGITQVTGTPRCAISTWYMKYGTVGGVGEATDATAAIMVPSGVDPACSGARPVLLYAHGTTVNKSFNMANLRDNAEASLVAANYAAQGFIVVAPNYAGYDVSSLPYHPYLNAEQQASDMVDALRAARKAFPAIGASPSSALLIAGYSQGGHVAMATQRAMQGQYASEFRVTALASMSGPYAILAFGDAVFGATPNLGGTVLVPLLTTSWQKSYGNVYASPSEIYEDRYVVGIESLLPSSAPDQLFSSVRLPQLALFASDSQPQQPVIPGTFGSDNLVKTSYRNLYLADLARNPCNTSVGDPLACNPALPFRQDGRRNDLRTYVPNVPVLLCGGSADPTVFFASTRATAGYFSAHGMPAETLSLLDLEAASAGTSDPYAALKVGFAQAKAKTAAAASASGGDPSQAVVTAYHGSLVPPFCLAAARGFFQSALAR
jgi:predicted esterase